MSGPFTENPIDLAEMRAAGHPAAQADDYSEEPLEEQPELPLNAAEHLEKYTTGVWLDVLKVFADHGYPELRHPQDLGRVIEGLFDILYRTDK